MMSKQVDEGFKEYVKELALGAFPGSRAEDLGYAWAVFSPEYSQYYPITIVPYIDVTIGDVENEVSYAQRTLANWVNGRW